MQKSIILGDREIRFTLNYKKIKNVNIRVKPDLSVNVSAPLKTNENQIMQLVKQSENFILSALSNYETLSKKKRLNLISGDRIFYLGESKTLIVEQGKAGVAIKGDKICLSVPNIKDFNLKNEVLSNWLSKECERIVLDLCKRAYKDFKDEVRVFPEIKFKNMRSRWGSCYLSKNRLTFAYMLVKAPLECINYVVYHEFVHFLEFNHSPKFYAKLFRFLPNRKVLKTKLKEFQ